ncbi:MAG: response regulator [Thermaerobacterales bacterium]
MPQQLITVMVVDDAPQVRESIKEMLSLEPDFVVVGDAQDGVDAVQKARDLRPDVILMDINLPEMDGISATEIIRKELASQVVMISVEKDPEYFRKAMQAGSRDYLVKPFTQEELGRAVRNAAGADPAVSSATAADGKVQRRQGKIVTVFGAKGGVGSSTLATNLAVALAKQGGARVALVDLDLELGSLHTMLGVRPRVTIVDLCRVETEINLRHAEGAVLQVPAHGVGLLGAPPYPHLAAEVEGEGKQQGHRNYVGEILKALQAGYDWVVVDTAGNYRESTLTAFDRASRILLVTTPDIPSLENTAKCLDLLVDQLEFDQEKIQVVLNQRDRMTNLTRDEISHGLDYPIAYDVPSDQAAVLAAMNNGRPITSKRTKSAVAEVFFKMASDLADPGEGGSQTGRPNEKGRHPGRQTILQRVGMFNLWSNI